MKVTDEWAAAGHPMKSDDAPDNMLLFIHVACPAPKDDFGHHSSFFSCEHTLYEYALDRDPSMKRLADYRCSRERDLANVTTRPRWSTSVSACERRGPTRRDGEAVARPGGRRGGTSGASRRASWPTRSARCRTSRCSSTRRSDSGGRFPAQRGAILYLVALIQDEANPRPRRLQRDSEGRSDRYRANRTSRASSTRMLMAPWVRADD